MDEALRFIADALDLVARALDDRAAPFRNLALATASATGAPRVRTVILRALDLDPLALTLFTDIRAGKVGDIAAEPRVSLLAWSEADKLQLRIEGRATVHGPGSDIARRFWQDLPPHGRNAYGLDATPGTAIPAPDAPHGLPDAERAGFFAAVTVTAERVDVLRLGPHGAQTRAIRDATGPRWVAP